MTLWLKNRRPKEWRDRKEVDVSGQLSLSAMLAQIVDNSGDSGDKPPKAGVVIDHEPLEVAEEDPDPEENDPKT